MASLNKQINNKVSLFHLLPESRLTGMTNKTMGQLKGVLTGKTRDNSSIIRIKTVTDYNIIFKAVAMIRLHGTPKNTGIMMGHAMSPRIREEFSGPQLASTSWLQLVC